MQSGFCFLDQIETDTARARGLPFPSLVLLQPALGAGSIDSFVSNSFSEQHQQGWLMKREVKAYIPLTPSMLYYLLAVFFY